MKVEYFNEPWKHAVIDDFFPPDIFQQILDTAPIYEEISTHMVYPSSQTRIGYDKIEKRFFSPRVGKPDFLNPSDLQNIFTSFPEIKDLHSVISEYHKSINEKMIEVEKQLRHVERNFEGYNEAFSVFWQRQPPRFVHNCHDEQKNKLMSVVVFVNEEENDGTFLYKEKVEKIGEDFWNPDKKIKWKQNRAFVFCGHPNLTWHSFAAREGYPRQTIVSFYRSADNNSN
jgi:hypothetical protein